MNSTRELVAYAVNVRCGQMKISKGNLAARLGIEQSTLANRLAGRRRLDTEQMDSMAQALGFIDGFALIAYAKNQRDEAETKVSA